MARIIHDETGVGAVGITDREKILAFVGLGADHHAPGTPISSEITRRAIRENRVFYADGVQGALHLSPVARLSPPFGPAGAAARRQRGGRHHHAVRAEEQTLPQPEQDPRRGDRQPALRPAAALPLRGAETTCWSQSELKLIQAQINPHFLFNALNTIIAVIRQDADRARELLLHLSNFFRKNLKRSGELATLEEELDHVNSYLKIEKARFEDRLRSKRTSTRPCCAETADLHPAADHRKCHQARHLGLLGQGVIHLRAHNGEGRVIISIEDNGGSFCAVGDGAGLGMSLVDKRIKNLCGESYGIAVDCDPARRTRISIALPPQGCR